jgi:hemerythrin superfamily protein
MVAGLRYRVKRAARQIGEQHRQMETLLGQLGAALGRADQGEARHLLNRYRGALDAHFSLEEEVFFPALHGLHPEHAGALETLSREHGEFAEALARLDGVLAAEALDAFLGPFRELVKRMAEHELREERLVGRLAEG